MEQKKASPGYSAGCLDQTYTALSSITLPSPSTKPPTRIVGEFVVVPYGLQFHIGRIFDTDVATREFKVEFMVRVGNSSEFVWLKDGDPRFEGPLWEYTT